MPQLLKDHQIDLVCIFATWPETYSYTLTECYMAKVPILTFDIGAVGDRIQKDQLGWVMNLENSDKILEKIREISNNKEEYRKIKENFENYQFKTIQEMQEFYKNLYQNSGKEASRKGHSIYDLLRYKEQNRAMEFNQYQATYGHLVHRYETLRKSKLWKIAKKIKGKCKKG